MKILTCKRILVFVLLGVLLITTFYMISDIGSKSKNENYSIASPEFVQITKSGRDVLCYNKETKVVYIESASYGSAGYYSRTLYLSSDGNPYKYNTETKDLEEIKIK